MRVPLRAHGRDAENEREKIDAGIPGKRIVLRGLPCLAHACGVGKPFRRTDEARLAAALYDDDRRGGWPRRCHGAFGGDGLYDVCGRGDRAGIPGARHWKGCGRKASGLCPKPAASGRTHERTAYCGRRQEGLLRKMGFRKMPGGGCGFALRRVLPGTRRNKKSPVPRLAAARNRAVLRLQYDFCTQKP